MYTFIFTKNTEKDFNKLDKIFQKRLIKKLKLLKSVDNIFIFISKLENLPPFTHRLRIGDIRVLLQQDSNNQNTFLILKFGNRGDVYK